MANTVYTKKAIAGAQKIDNTDYTKGGTTSGMQQKTVAPATKIDTTDTTKANNIAITGTASNKVGPSGSREMVPKDQETQYYYAQNPNAPGVANTGRSSNGGYSGLQGVSDNTAQNVSRYQQGYQQSERVTNALNMLEQNEAAKPQGYTSKYGAQLDEILNKIQNPQEFKYSFNGDNLFKSYADSYMQQGKQAAMNAAGQAAALTGGYGNSAGTMAAAQANQQWLTGLYDRGMDLYDRAYGAYRDQLGDLKDQYGLLSDQEQRDYDRFRDQYGDWLNEREYLTARADMERSLDRGEFESERDYWTALANAENADYWTQQNFAENQRQYDQNYAEQIRQFNAEMEEKQRQFNESLDWDKMSERQKYAAEYAMQMLQNGQMPSEELLQSAGLSAADARKLMKQTTTGGGGTARTPTPKPTPTPSSPGINLVGAEDGAAAANGNVTTLNPTTPAGPVNQNQKPLPTLTWTTPVDQILQNGLINNANNHRKK